MKSANACRKNHVKMLSDFPGFHMQKLTGF